MKSFFPVLGNPLRVVPWAIVEAQRTRIERYHGQTLERLAERGGLTTEELAMHGVAFEGQVTRAPKAVVPPPHGAPAKY